MNKNINQNNYPGVNWDGSRGRWVARIKLNGKNKHIGYFENHTDAVFARKKFEIENDEIINETKRKLQKYKNEVINLYSNGFKISEIAKIYNKDYTVIHDIIKNSNSEFRYDNIKINDEIAEKIITEYKDNFKSAKQISDNNNFSDTQVRYHLKKANITIRKRMYEFIDENFMKKIDENWKAYFLGLFYADGCMCKSSFNLAISLIEKDSYILEKLCDKIFYNYNLIYDGGTKIKIDKSRNKPYKKQPNHKINISSRIVYNDLLSYGCIPAKSLTIEYPKNLPLEYFSHFLRGYFDGDGTISVNRTISICCSDVFALQVQKILKDECNIISHIRKRDKIYSLELYSAKEVYNFYKLIYTDCEDIYITRKKDRFEHFFKNGYTTKVQKAEKY